MLYWSQWAWAEVVTEPVLSFPQVTGHGAAVNAVAYSPDGTRIVSGSSDDTVKIWDAQTGNELMTLAGHTWDVVAVAYSPDGTRIVSGGGFNENLKIWDAQTGNELMTLAGHSSSAVNAVAYSPDGTRIISGGYDDTVKIWDAQTGNELMTLEGHSNGVNAVAYSPDGTRIVSGSWDSTVKIWDAQTGNALMTLAEHSGGVYAVAYSPDGTRIVSGSWKELKIWDAQTGNELMTLAGHSSGVSTVAYSPDGTRIVSGSWDDTVKIWDAQTGNELMTLAGHTSNVRAVTYSPDGLWIASGSLDGTIKIWHSGLVFTNHTLTISKTGNGTVTSTSAGINCGADCSENYSANTHVTLTAMPASSYSFIGWSGACSGNQNTCNLTMSSNKEVTATFTSTQTYTFNVTKTGNGTITSNPDGISCGSDCNENYALNTYVTLTAVPSNGYKFSDWSGSCSGTNTTATVTITASKRCSATFVLQINDNANPAHITNISTRAHTSTGLSSVIGGFTIQGTGSCDVMIRGFGKGIGLSPTLDTQLLLQTFPQATQLAQNSSWQIGNPVSSIPAHLHLPDPTDAGIYTRLNAGAYTATMTPQGVTGIGLIGVDEVNCDAGTQLVNISTRAEDRTGAEAMIAGFTIEGEGTIKVMIRGFGSGLGLSSCLDTQIKLQKFPSGDFVASNDSWQSAANAGQIPAALQLPNATDAGLLINLPAGAYTAIMTPVTGSCNGIG